jgi:hypothetical protein
MWYSVVRMEEKEGTMAKKKSADFTLTDGVQADGFEVAL